MPQTDVKCWPRYKCSSQLGGTVPVINVKGISPGQMKLDGSG
jgi:hypothetical protein